MATRVYLVEDHPVMRDSVVAFLRLKNLEVCGVAGTAEAAAENLKMCEPDLILLDLSLPGRSGLDLLRQINGGPCIPCIVLSGHREARYVGRAFAAGAKAYVLKGRPTELLQAIDEVLAGRVYLSESLRSDMDGMDAARGA